MIPRSLPRLLLALLPAGMLSAQATVFQGPPGGVGDVLVYGGIGAPPSRPAELQGIRLLPVDAAGRSTFTQFLPDQPRLASDLPAGVTRILLPQAQGALYRYRRNRVGGADFGYFLVRANGLASFLVSVPGTGPQGTEDPIPHPVAVSAQGDALLFSTRPAAGGDLFEVDLATLEVHALTPGLPPLDVPPQGLMLLESWGVAMTTKGPLRFLRGGDQPLLVPLRPRAGGGGLGHNPPSTPPTVLSHFGTGLARSADGGTVAVVAGVSSSQAHVFTFGPGGPAVCVNDAPAPIVDPGLGVHAGPFLALSPDGRRAAWKADIGTGECFARTIPVQPTPPEIQLTGDANFADTLNDSGVIAFFDPNSVIMLVGEFNGVGGVEKADFYRTTFAAGAAAPSYANLTKTSGDTVLPFLAKGELETSDGLFLLPAKNGLVYFVSGSSGQGEIYRTSTSTGAVQVLRDGIDQLDFVERAGSNLVLGFLHDRPFQRELLRVPFDLAQPSASLGIFGGTQTFANHAGNAAGIFAGALNVAAGRHSLGQLQLPNGPGDLLSGTYTSGPTLGFDGSGALLATVQDTQNAYFIRWSLANGPAYYGRGPVGSVVLPGN